MNLGFSLSSVLKISILLGLGRLVLESGLKVLFSEICGNKENGGKYLDPLNLSHFRFGCYFCVLLEVLILLAGNSGDERLWLHYKIHSWFLWFQHVTVNVTCHSDTSNAFLVED